MPMLYAPGSTPVAVTPRGFAVFEHGASAALLTRVRSVVAEGRGLGGVIESLTGAYGASLTAIPAFAVALVEGDSVRIAVRGDFAFDVDADAPERVSGAGVTTWTERVVRGVRRVTLQSGAGEGADPAELPVTDGVVLASTIVWDAATAAVPVVPAPAATAPAPVPEPVSAPAPVALPAVLAPVVEAPTAAPVAAAPVAATPVAVDAVPATRRGAASTSPSPEPAGNVPGLIDSSTVQTVAGDETLLPEDSELSQSRPETSAAGPVGGDASSTTGHDPLWGATVVRPVEDVPAAPAPGDHDGATISLAQARALRAGREAAAAAEAPTSTTPPLAPPRPPAPGRIRVSTGQVLLLDRTVVIGRRPRSTRVSGTDLPHLVAVDSPQQDISRSHVELRVEGESIVATDLRTTNGTTLLRTAADPMRLHPGEATVVIPGDVLDLGDGITVAIEGLS
ncbi:FHA domain-containing protein [Microbacterium sp. NPDC058389]|uniref:FHA domain-containing protein n=1 Tax=Microbacterium sp. NPDC058389 TaxID=3346475 RepID=UPI00366A13A5